MEANAKVPESFPASNSAEQPAFADALGAFAEALERFVLAEPESDCSDWSEDDGAMDDVALEDFRAYHADRGI